MSQRTHGAASPSLIKEMLTFLLDDNRGPHGAMLLENPAAIIRADSPDEVARALDDLNEAQKRGFIAAGFLSFELGLLFSSRHAPTLPEQRTTPLLMFGVFERERKLTSRGVDEWLAEEAGSYRLGAIEPSLTKAAYTEKFNRAREYIAAGDIYQLNLTFKARFHLNGSVKSLYRDLRAKQRVSYGTLILTDDFSVLSLSPELFIESDGERISTRPMKGTARRGRTFAEDETISRALAQDTKNRAENLMIVDLMRNDLARIAKLGSVEVTDLYTVETFDTVHQMTSGVRAQLPPGMNISGILHALFPPGSVTGAPKVRALEIIRELEETPRGVYTGAIGVLSPHRGSLFNVAIRTLHVGRDGAGEIGIGSGVVQDSEAQSEYDECLLKLKFMTGSGNHADFELIETLLFDGQGYVLLSEHIRRLHQSAQYFAFKLDRSGVMQALAKRAAGLAPGSHRVRLTVKRTGEATITSNPIAAPLAHFSFVLAEDATDPDNVFLYHKTTNRRFYEETRVRLSKLAGCDEVVFRNNRGELTEGSFTNLFIRQGEESQLLTPAVSCGLLPGTLRQAMIERGEAREARLTADDLANASAIWLGNSVRGLIPAKQIALPTL
jgi:para-aminobenzoate synthetase/4-amino-4-deoxychorismate lyase